MCTSARSRVWPFANIKPRELEKSALKKPFLAFYMQQQNTILCAIHKTLLFASCLSAANICIEKGEVKNTNADGLSLCLLLRVMNGVREPAQTVFQGI
jgi:hypothetical protein